MIETQEKLNLTDEDLEKLTKEELVLKFKQLKKYTVNLEEKEKKHLIELAKLKNIVLMNYVSSKELESTNQFQESSSSSSGNLSSTAFNSNQSNKLKQSFVDPSINAIIVQLKRELEEARKKNEELQLELNSTKFTPESQITKRLMAKCRKLQNENEELGKIISSGNVAQLEHDLAYHKQLLNETCENEQNLNSFLFEIDSQMDAMQATIIKQRERLNELQITNNNHEIKNENTNMEI